MAIQALSFIHDENKQVGEMIFYQMNEITKSKVCFSGILIISLVTPRRVCVYTMYSLFIHCESIGKRQQS